MREFSEANDIGEISGKQTDTARTEITPEAKRKLDFPDFGEEWEMQNADLSSPEDNQKKKLEIPQAEDFSQSEADKSPDAYLSSPRSEIPRNNIELSEGGDGGISHPDMGRPEVSQPLSVNELPENSQMIDSSKIDMSAAMGMDDPNFWNHHGHGKNDYMELASHLPEVQERLEGGEALDDLMKDPDVGATARQYYSPDKMIRLEEKPNGEYAYIDDGRHRIQAAREQGYDIPFVSTPYED